MNKEFEAFAALAKKLGYKNAFKTYEGFETEAKILNGIPIELAIWKDSMAEKTFLVSVCVDGETLESMYNQIGWGRDSVIHGEDIECDLSDIQATMAQDVFTVTDKTLNKAIKCVADNAYKILKEYNLV